MRPFTYQAPTSVAEAVSLLDQGGTRARALAGGTDLLVQLRRGLYDLDLVVDVKRIPALSQISVSPAHGLTVGAAVSCARLCEHPEVVARYPGLIDAASIIGGTAIQGRATIGGNLCNAAPSGDSIPVMIAMQATCTVAGPEGTRTIPAEAFCIAPGQTVLRPGEMLTAIRFPPPAPGTGACYLRFIPRHEMDIAVAGAGVWVALDGSRISAARIALSAVAPTPLLVEAAGATLVGKVPTEDAFAEAARLAQEAARPITDMRGTQAQRCHLVGVLVKRALRRAVERAQGGIDG